MIHNFRQIEGKKTQCSIKKRSRFLRKNQHFSVKLNFLLKFAQIFGEIEYVAMINFTNFSVILTNLLAHSVIFYKIRSHSIFLQNLKFFRENNLLIAHRVRYVSENSNFDRFGAKLRKFHQYGVKIDTLDYINQLKHLPRTVQIDFY